MYNFVEFDSRMIFVRFGGNEGKMMLRFSSSPSPSLFYRRRDKRFETSFQRDVKFSFYREKLETNCRMKRKLNG